MICSTDYSRERLRLCVLVILDNRIFNSYGDTWYFFSMGNGSWLESCMTDFLMQQQCHSRSPHRSSVLTSRTMTQLTSKEAKQERNDEGFGNDWFRPFNSLSSRWLFMYGNVIGGKSGWWRRISVGNPQPNDGPAWPFETSTMEPERRRRGYVSHLIESFHEIQEF